MGLIVATTFKDIWCMYFKGCFFLNEFLVWIYQGFLVLASMVHG